MYVIKNNLTGEYCSDEGFYTSSFTNACFYDTLYEAENSLKDIIYYSRYEKDELSILKVTFKLVEVQK